MIDNSKPNINVTAIHHQQSPKYVRCTYISFHWYRLTRGQRQCCPLIYIITFPNGLILNSLFFTHYLPPRRFIQHASFVSVFIIIYLLVIIKIIIIYNRSYRIWNMYIDHYDGVRCRPADVSVHNVWHHAASFRIVIFYSSFGSSSLISSVAFPKWFSHPPWCYNMAILEISILNSNYWIIALDFLWIFLFVKFI